MKAQLWINSTKHEEFNHITQAMNYTRFHNIKQYCVLLIDESGYSLYDSLRGRWSFPASEQLAHRSIGSLLA